MYEVLSQMLIVSVSEESVVAEGGRAREGGKEELENILPVRLACAWLQS